MMETRREFLKTALATAIPAAAGCASLNSAMPEAKTVKQGVVTPEEEEVLARWQIQTEAIEPHAYAKYTRSGDTQNHPPLIWLEKTFARIMEEVKTTIVPEGAPPAVWSVYNMGYIVKTPKTMFSIDLVHRRAVDIAPLLDFALITHNHGDHWRKDFYDKMNGAHKTVISNFNDNYGVRDWKKDGGYIRGVKEFHIGDVMIRTSLIDHNAYLIDYTTAFEIKVGDFIIYHTGDSGWGTEPKLNTVWGRPDLWLFFPGCGIDVAKAVQKVQAKRIVFGHLWELGHGTGHHGRLDEPLIKRALKNARPYCDDVTFALWGDRII